MPRISDLSGDPKLEKEGTWVEIGAGISVKIARANNDAYETFIRKSLQAKGVQVSNLDDMEADEILKPIFISAVARHIIIDWKNVEEEDPTDPTKLRPLPYSPAAAEKELQNKDFLNRIMVMSRRAATFKKREEDSALGN